MDRRHHCYNYFPGVGDDVYDPRATLQFSPALLYKAKESKFYMPRGQVRRSK